RDPTMPTTFDAPSMQTDPSLTAVAADLLCRSSLPLLALASNRFETADRRCAAARSRAFTPQHLIAEFVS
ncbi:MAG: hypothetical protein E6614_29270, partial [Bradyrhizobium sp.]|nr:hypothetical protein [Bradyrhizobium sp.]